MTGMKAVQTQRNEAKPEPGLLKHVDGSQPRLARAEKRPEQRTRLFPPRSGTRAALSEAEKILEGITGQKNPNSPSAIGCSD